MGITELVLAVANHTTATARWQLLLAPTPVTIPGTATLSAGPVLRLAPGSDDGMARIVFGVKDLDRAAAFLDQQGLLGERSAARASITPERIQTLHLDFMATAE